MGFNSVATSIIQDSIKSAVFIDDKVLLPFEEEKDGLINHSDMYFTFIQRQCSLTFYRFEKDWQEHENYLFDNRDLIILDWQLTESEPKYIDALKILETAIQKESLHFCSIYTKVEENNNEDQILFKILYYFNYLVDFNKVNLNRIKDIFTQFCEDNGLNEDDLLLKLKPKLKETLLYWENIDRKKNSKKEIYSILLDELNNRQQWNSIFEEYSLNLFEGLFCLFFALEEFGFPSSQRIYPIKIYYIDKQWRIYINDSIIIISNKKTIGNDKFYDSYKNYLIKEKNVFLTLLGLEIKNKFRQSSGFIGNELSEISQIAFFYHNKNKEKKEFKIEQKELYEFLKKIWLDQATSIFHQNNLKLLEEIEDFIEQHEIIRKVEKFEENISTTENHQKELFHLNKFYNVLNYNPQKDDLITFGDIFKSVKDGAEVYFLCITPLCDCVSPDKIDHQYSFVRHENVINNYYNCLKDAEGKHVSFIKFKDEMIGIDWGKSKPFTLYIKNPNILSPSKIHFLNKYWDLEFVCRLKENYAQRIANHAYQYPLRVGVSFAQIPKDK